MHSCGCTFVQIQTCAVVPLYMHNCAHNDAVMLSCSCACTHAYIRAVVCLCKGSRIDKAQKRTLPSCLYDGYAQQNLTHLLSLSHLLRASRSRDTSSSWLMPKFVQMQSMSSPSSRCQVATCSTCEKIHVALEYDVEETEEIVLAHIVIVPNPLLQVTLFIADPVNCCNS